MLKTAHCAVLLGVALLACTAGVASTSTGSAAPQQQAEVTSPTSGLHVTASIVAVTLGEPCGSTGGIKAPAAGDCATPPAKPDAGSSGGSKPVGGCEGFCHQSNVQIAFSAGAGAASARVEIVRVDLISEAGSVVDTLAASKPQLWIGNGYSSWDQTVKPAGDAKTSYDLTAPAWSTISTTGNAYAAKYRLHVTLRIDGVEIILESNDLSRDPPVAT